MKTKKAKPKDPPSVPFHSVPMSPSKRQISRPKRFNDFEDMGPSGYGAKRARKNDVTVTLSAAQGILPQTATTTLPLAISAANQPIIATVSADSLPVVVSEHQILSTTDHGIAGEAVVSSGFQTIGMNYTDPNPTAQALTTLIDNTLNQTDNNISVAMPDNNISVALPIDNGLRLVGPDGQAIALETCGTVVETAIPVVPMCTLKANAQHPAWCQELLKEVLQTGGGYDAVWFCKGGVFRVHKFVLASFSEHMRQILNQDENEAAIHTPDLPSEIVRSILCLMYTGEAAVTWSDLQQINDGCRLIGFCGKDMTAIPAELADQSPSKLEFSYSKAGAKKEVTFSQIKITSFLAIARTQQINSKRSLKTDTDYFSPLDDSFLQDPPTMNWIKAKQEASEPEKAIKIELESDAEGEEIQEVNPLVEENADADKNVDSDDNPPANDDFEDDQENDENFDPKAEKAKTTPAPKTKSATKKKTLKKKKKSVKPKYVSTTMTQLKENLGILMDEGMTTTNETQEVVRTMTILKNDRPLYNKCNMYENLRTTQYNFGVVNKNRGILSHKLPFDLIDDQEVAKGAKTLAVCPICLKVFNDRRKMKDHRAAFHDQDSPRNPMIVKRNQFKCNKCDKEMELDHLVWFVKHYKFCGVDDQKANAVLKLGETEKEDEELAGGTRVKKSPDDCYLEVNNKRKFVEICKNLLGKVCPVIWGCRKCYKPFDSELALQTHVDKVHQGRDDHGTCFDTDSRIYSCGNCKIYKTNRNLILFMNHLIKCNKDAQGPVAVDDEEDVDEDTFDDFVDPWGIIKMPLKVKNMRSQWICEAIFGQLFETLFPCHICYSIFHMDDELREHFRINHPGIENKPENGSYYNQADKSFTCPACSRSVCKKQRNSIYFAYHMLKCNGKLHTVEKPCGVCGKTFKNFRALEFHMQSNCETKQFVCHMCGSEFKIKQSLRNHVKYAHTTVQNHKCNVCDAAFKREGDLNRHMKRHMETNVWSCETCGKSFSWEKALKNHLRTHMAEEEKQHVCNVCGHRFARRTFLINHMTTHSSYRGFVCDVCNAQVKTRDTLQQHRRKVHGLYGSLPEKCILKPPDALDSSSAVPDSDLITVNPLPQKSMGKASKGRGKKKGQNMQTSSIKIKEEVLPTLDHDFLL